MESGEIGEGCAVINSMVVRSGRNAVGERLLLGIRNK